MEFEKETYKDFGEDAVLIMYQLRNRIIKLLEKKGMNNERD